MRDAAPVGAPDRKQFLTSRVALVRARVPTFAEASLVIASALLLVLAFPNFDLWPLAWFGLVPLLVVAGQTGQAGRALVLGWLWGAVFFFGSCWWLTYSMIHYAHLPSWAAYLLLIPPVALGASFPALFCFVIARLTTRFGPVALYAAPFVWATLEWARYLITGEAWNSIGYSQAFKPALIQAARFGGVYAVGFLIVLANAAIALALIRRRIPEAAASTVILILITLVLATTHFKATSEPDLSRGPRNLIVAVQANVPMDGSDSPTAMRELLDRHIDLSLRGLREGRNEFAAASLVIWPESPMSFSYTTDPKLQKIVTDFAIANHTSVLLNSLEPAPNGGSYNSAIMVNEEGRKVAQYDKIRLMPFGEYVPLPSWLPGASSVRAIVGEFTPGSSYTLMPLGDLRAGVFICVEAAHPSIARTFTSEGADMLINISNDGYLGPTPVMRQHLANAIFRAVENDRPLRRITNTGISADIDSTGRVRDATSGFEPTVRSWTAARSRGGTTFYTRHGELFVYACLAITLGLIGGSFFMRSRSIRTSTIKRG